MDTKEINIVNELIEFDSKTAFALLFKKYSSKIYNLALYYYHNSEDAEEIVQEVFLRIWNNRKNIKNPAAFSSLLYTTAKNLIYDSYKKQIHTKAYADYLRLYGHQNCLRNTEETVLFNELNNYYHELLEQMPEKRKAVFILSRNHGLSNKEIAEQLNISVRTVEEHIHQAVKHLKKFIAERYQLLIFLLSVNNWE